MLLRAFFLLFLITLLSETLVHGAAALARSALHHRALDAARIELAAAISSERDTIAKAVQQGQTPQALPSASTAPMCVSSGSNGCELYAQAQIAVASASPAASPPACANTNCTIYLQANDSVAEGRATVNFHVSVVAANGAPLASRDATVLYRTFDTPPYATPAGSLDATLGDAVPAGAGDDGGATGNAATLVNVEYLNASNPSSTPIPGNVWRPRTENPPAAGNAWDY